VSISVFTILGRVTYSVGGESRAAGQPRLQAIVGALLIQAGRPISRTQLAEWVWRDEDSRPADLAATMHTYAGRIRKILARADGIATLVVSGGSFRIDADPNLIDYHVFRATAEQARLALSRGEANLARTKAAEAIGLWQQEEPMAGLTSTKVDNWRRRVIADEWVPAQDTLLQALLRIGDFHQALLRLDDLQRDHPDHPTFIKRRVQTLHGFGRVGDATEYHLAQYKALRERGEDTAADELAQLHQRAIARPTVTIPERPQPPSPAPRPLRHRIPPDVPTFVGRETYLAKLDALTGRGTRPGLIVLDGQGGVGKTALALHWAHQLGKPESTFYYDLQGVGPGPRHEAGEVVTELLAALDYQVERLADPTRREHKLRDLLTETRLVIVLDNVQNTGQVRPLLPLLGDSTVLLTSRQRLTGLRTLHHAIPLPINPLATHQGATLLTRLLGRRAAEAPQAVTTLALLSGGLPMALRVIAHHVERHPRVPFAEIIDDLQDAATLLGIGEDGDIPAVSLRATFELSYGTLSPSEQDLFATLALHPGHDIGLPAATALAGQPAHIVRKGLETLVGAHMLEPTGSIRRYRLHDLLRSFSQELALARSPESHEGAQLRLLSWYLHTSFRASRTMFPNRPLPELLPIEPDVTPLDFATGQQAGTWLADERDNLLDIITWCRTRHPSYADRLPSALYRTLRQYGHYADARQAVQIAVDAAHAVGDVGLEGGSRHDLGQLLLALGLPIEAGHEFHRAAGLAQLEGSDLGIAMSTYSLAGIAIRAGKFDEGIELYHRALGHAKSADLVETQSAIIFQLGQAYRLHNSRLKAYPYYQQALWLAGSLHDSHLVIKTLVPLAEISAELGDHASAQAHGTRALELVVASHDLEEASAVFLAMARVSAANAQHGDAVNYARQALGFARRRRDIEAEAEALDALATSLVARRCLDGAREGWELARELYLDRGDRGRVAAIVRKLEKLPEPPADIPTARKNSADNVAVNYRSVIED
jgi:tetratricopeptide (TPR) repeat protein/DNA-binding winged helix-turn-helix (wHTH) protein